MLVNISMHLPETNFCYVADKSCPLDTLFYLFSYTPALPNVAVCFVQCQFLWKRLSNNFFRKDYAFQLERTCCCSCSKGIFTFEHFETFEAGIREKKTKEKETLPEQVNIQQRAAVDFSPTSFELSQTKTTFEAIKIVEV